jgi:hypothetical protein
LCLLNSHHPVRPACVFSQPKNFAYISFYRTIGAARMYRSLTKQGSFTDYSYDQRIPSTLYCTLTSSLSFLGRIRPISRQGCQLLTYIEMPTPTAARCTSRPLTRPRGRKGRWPRRLCSSQQTRHASNSFLAPRPPPSLCQPYHIQKSRSPSRLPTSARDGANEEELGRPSQHYLSITFCPCIYAGGLIRPIWLRLKGKVPSGL